MEIRYLGQSAFRLSTRGAALVTDPFDEQFIGLKFPKVEADIVTISHDHRDHNNASVIPGSPLVISGPGEYEVKNVRIQGISAFHDEKKGSERGKNTIYAIMMEGITIVHCGDLGHKLEEAQAELLPDIDVLLIPTGGFYTIGSSEASEIVTKLEPKIVIPMHYSRPGLASELAKNLEPVDAFFIAMGKEKASPLPKLVVNKTTLPQELEVIVLES